MKKYVFFKVFRKMTNPKNRINIGENGILKNKTLKVMDKGKAEHIYQIEDLIPYIKQWPEDRRGTLIPGIMHRKEENRLRL